MLIVPGTLKWYAVFENDLSELEVMSARCRRTR
jgi:hypothetical protein